MAGDNSARLVATLEARVNKFERDLGKASGTARREFGTIEKRGQEMAKRLETTVSGAASKASSALSVIGASFAGGFVAGGLTGFVSEMKQATRSITELSAEAKRAGLGVEAFQELSYAARQNNVSVDALTDGMKELQLRADEFIVTGKGSGAEAFARLGYSADELKAKLRDPSMLFVEIIGRLAALRDTAAQIRIADEIFGGTGGEQFVRFLEEGEGGLKRNIEEARKLGVVIDEDVVRKGVELDKQFQKIADTIDSRVKGAVVGVATSIGTWATNAEKFLNSVGNSEFFRKLNDLFADKTDPSIQWNYGQPQKSNAIDPKGLDMLRRAMTAAGDRAAVSAPDRSKWLPGTFVDPKLAGMKADFQTSLAGFIQAARDAGHDLSIQSGVRSSERQAELFAAAVRKYGSEAEARKWVAPPGRSYHEKGTAADLNYAGGGMKGNSPQANAARQWAHANASRFGLTFPLGNEAWHVEPEGQRGQPKMGDPDTTALEQQKVKRTDAQIAADKQAAAVKRVMEALSLESAQMGQTAEKQRLLQELQSAGVDLNSKEGQAIAAKVQQLYALKSAQEAAAQSAEQLKETREAMADIGADATKGLISDFRNGVSAADAFANALNKIADRLIDMAIDNLFKNAFAAPAGGAGGGAGGGILGSIGSLLFGGARKKGGPTKKGKYYLVGEEGPELFAPDKNGTILPQQAAFAAHPTGGSVKSSGGTSNTPRAR